MSFLQGSNNFLKQLPPPTSVNSSAFPAYSLQHHQQPQSSRMFFTQQQQQQLHPHHHPTMMMQQMYAPPSSMMDVMQQQQQFFLGPLPSQHMSLVSPSSSTFVHALGRGSPAVPPSSHSSMVMTMPPRPDHIPASLSSSSYNMTMQPRSAVDSNLVLGYPYASRPPTQESASSLPLAYNPFLVSSSSAMRGPLPPFKTFNDVSTSSDATPPPQQGTVLPKPRKRQIQKIQEDLKPVEEALAQDGYKRSKHDTTTKVEHLPPPHDVGLGGQDRLQIDFISLGSLPSNDVPIQTFGRCRLVIPTGLSGTHRMYSQAWKFEIVYNVGAMKTVIVTAPGASVMGACCLTWRVTNLFSGHVTEMTETLQQATLRQESGRTISNIVMQQAMEDRARDVEVALEREMATGTTATTNSNHDEDTTSSFYNPIRQVNLRNVIRKLRPKRCGEGLLFFGLRHDIVQQQHDPSHHRAPPQTTNNTATVTVEIKA
jgi:hypothetical protein